MIALIQRVSEASVTVEGEVTGAIGQGLLVLLGVEQGDDEAKADKLLHKVSGSLLVVSQFTLAADTGTGMRPSFSGGAHPADAERLYEYFVARARESGVPTETGRFAADMKVRLLNDGPVTFWLQV